MVSTHNPALKLLLREAHNLQELSFKDTTGFLIESVRDRKSPFIDSLPEFKSLRKLEFHQTTFYDDDDVVSLIRHLTFNTLKLQLFRHDANI